MSWKIYCFTEATVFLLYYYSILKFVKLLFLYPNLKRNEFTMYDLQKLKFLLKNVKNGVAFVAQ